MSRLSDELKRVKQELFDEMVEGNPQQPHECVDSVMYALKNLWPSWSSEFQSVLDYYPEY